MMKHLFCAITLLLPANAFADIYSGPLSEIEANSTELVHAAGEYRAAVAENSTGLTPENPEVEFGYLWGNRETGNRKDISVSQAFDFPSVYARRRGLAREKDRSALWQQKARRHDLLLQAKELLIELVYANAMEEICRTRLDNARKTRDVYAKMLELGQTTAIEANKAELNLTDAENELRRIQMEGGDLRNSLTALNGGKEMPFSEKSYPSAALPGDFSHWLEQAEKSSPALQFLASETDVNRRNESLVKAEGLPKLSVGYQGELVRGSNFNGVTVGVSIPLWENRNRVRAAKENTVASEEAARDARIQYAAYLESQFNRAKTLSAMEAKYTSALKEADNSKLLEKVLGKGVISLTEYLNAEIFDFTIREKLLATQRDRELALARLTSPTL